MAHPDTKILMKEITDKLEEHGVNDYVLALRDPDDRCDEIQAHGSPIWWMGIGTCLMNKGTKFAKLSIGKEPEDEDSV